MKVAVVGASGRAGSEITKELAARRYRRSRFTAAY